MYACVLVLGAVLARVRSLRSVNRKDGTFQRLDALFAAGQTTAEFDDDDKWSVYSAVSHPRVVSNYSSNSTKIEAAATTSTSSVVVCNNKPYDHGILFLGGFGDAPAYWDRLLPYMNMNIDIDIDPAAGQEKLDCNDDNQNKKEKVFCYAPRTPGWGRTDFREARKISYKDWVLHGREAAVLVSALCSRVTVVGHSTGALVAAAVAEEVDGMCSRMFMFI